MPRHTSLQLRESVLRLFERGKKSREISSLLSIGKTTVNNIISKFKATGSVADRPRCGRPRKTSLRVDKLIKRKSVADVRKNARTIAQELRDENLADVSRSTVSRRLLAVRLYGRVGVKKPLIRKKNQMARLDFAKKYSYWNSDDWKKILFSDESKFQLFGTVGRQYVRRPAGTRYDSRYQIPTVKHGGGGVMVWGAFSAQGVGPLVEINEVMDRYIYKNILEDHMLPYAKKKCPVIGFFNMTTIQSILLSL